MDTDETYEVCEHECGPEWDEDASDDYLEALGMPGYEEPRCRACGCSERQACPGGCIWATPDLCSKCVEV